MINVRIKVRIDYEPARVMAAYKQAARRAITRGAARVRILQRRSMRRRSSSSAPGQPPRVVGGQIRNFIRYAYLPSEEIAVVGPERLPGADGDTLEALEHGKTTTRRVGRRRRIRRLVRYDKRPSAGPALLTASGNMPDYWADSFSR